MAEIEEIGQEKAKELLGASLGAFYMLADTLNSIAPLVQALEEVLKTPVAKENVRVSDTGIISHVKDQQEFTGEEIAKLQEETTDGSDKLDGEQSKGTTCSD
mgnify:CR=1 FL=1